MEAEWSLFPTSKQWGIRKGFCAQEPHRGLLGFSFFSSNVFPLWFLPDAHLQTGMGLWWNFHLSVANWERKKEKKKKKRTACEFLMRLGLFNFKDCLLFWGNDLPFGVKMFFLLWNDYESKCHFLSSPHIAIEKPGSSRWGPFCAWPHFQLLCLYVGLST